tara:strand:- start:358 stop:2604 length:2247 start_codon:yes stop_codon:yes gene_type:complete
MSANTFSLKEFPNQKLIKNIWTHPDIWTTQRDEVRKYCDFYKETGINIKYIKYYKYGRFFVKDHKIRSSTIMWNAIRSALFKDTEYDLDIVNCHSNLLLDICKTNDFYDIDNLKYYCENRDDVINLFEIDEQIITEHNKNNKTNYDKKDIVKNLITIVLYGGSVETWRKEFNIDCELPKFITDFINEIQINTNLIIKSDKRFKDIVEYETIRRLEKAKKKFGKLFDIQLFFIKPSKILSIILQEYETLIIMKSFEIVKNNNFTITSYNYDGFQILKQEGADELVNTINNTEFVLSHNNKVFINFENIKFIIKPFKNAINTKDLVLLDTDDFNIKTFNLSQSYGFKKEYFEKYFAKILSPTMFVETKKDDYVLYKRNDYGIAFQHLHYWELKEKKMVKKPFIMKWLCDEDIRFYNNVNYYPTMNMCPDNTFNLWNDFPIKSIPLDNDADTSLIHFHLKTLLKEDEKNYEWFLNWLAHIVQFPHIKTEVCIVLYDKKFGTGKSLIAEEFLKKIIGIKKIIITCRTDKVFGKFSNSQGKLLCVLNEASGKDTYDLNEAIKESITGKTLEMEKKGIDAIQITDYLNYILTTNNLNCVKLEEGDRRFMVFNTSSKMKGDVEYFKNLASVLDDDVIMRKFYEELINRKLSNFNAARDRQNNTTMDIMKEHNVDVVLEFINYWKEEIDDTDEHSMIKSRMKGMDLYKEFIKYYEMCGNNANSKPSLPKFGTRIKEYDDKVSFVRKASGVVYSIIY